MAIFKLENQKFIELENTSFISENIKETNDLQKFIINSIEIIDNELLVISNEFGDWEDSRRKIDILCLDKDANLVVIELKRTESGGHMELQSIRYAAMISSMTFDKAVKTFSEYLLKTNDLNKDAEDIILNFLGWSDIQEEDFANDVRIILISADFSKEITTSVLWLIDRKIDIKCIKIKLQKDQEKLYFDIQQIIPLKETADYQVRLREKIAEKRESLKRLSENNRDYSKFNLSINNKTYENLNKRQTMITTIKRAINFGLTPEELIPITKKRKWFVINKACYTTEEFDEIAYLNERSYDPKRWFNNNDELFVFENKTYVFSNQHGKGTFDLVTKIFETYPNLNGIIKKID